MRRIAGAFLIHLLLPVPGGADCIAAILSQDAAPYREALDGFRRELAAQEPRIQVQVYDLQNRPESAPRIVAQAVRGPCKLLLALGSLATTAAARNPAGLPVVGGLVLRSSDLSGANVTGVWLELPADVQLRKIAELLPRVRRLGLLYSAAENGEFAAQARRDAAALGLRLEPVAVDRPQDLPPALDRLMNRAEALWGIPDSVVYTPQTSTSLLLFSFRHRIPLIGVSESWARAGALLSLDRDYRDVGAQLAGMAVRIVRGASPSSIPREPPRRVVYSLNLRTASQLGVEIPEEVRNGAEHVY